MSLQEVADEMTRRGYTFALAHFDGAAIQVHCPVRLPRGAVMMPMWIRGETDGDVVVGILGSEVDLDSPDVRIPRSAILSISKIGLERP
jgi:hypothetical protein